VNDFRAQLINKTDLPAAALKELLTELLNNFNKHVPADKISQEV